MNKPYKFAAIIIIGISLALAITSVWNDTPIVDEIPHIGAGYSYISKMDYRLNPEHPPLAKDLAGIALKIYGIQDDTAFNSQYWQQDLNGQWNFGRTLIFNSGNDAQRLAHIAKLPMLIFFVLSAILIFLWAESLSGYLGGLIALFLFVFSPTVMAHARFVTTDVPALFGILLASYFFIHYLKNPTKKHLIFASIALGIAELTKFSVFLLVLFLPVMAIIHAFISIHRGKIKKAAYNLASTIAIIAIGYIFIVWPVYIFHTWNYPIELQHSQTKTLLQSYGNRKFADPVVYLSSKPVIRSLAQYGLGLLMVNQRAVGGNTTYFLGQVSKDSWPQYFPIVYFIKEPLPFWGLILVVILFLAIKFRPRHLKSLVYSVNKWAKENFDTIFMGAWIILYWAVTIRANLNIGVRHLMPVYGFTFIILANVLVWIAKTINSKKLVIGFWSFVISLLGWYLYENLSVYPFYLTYFNQVAGGPSGGYRYVVDSNVDWGQDLKRLTDWVNQNNINKISFDYFGWSDQTYYLKNKLVWIHAGQYRSSTEFLRDNPEGGYIAVSASFFMGSIESPATSYAWLNDYQPVAFIGNSIFAWYIPPK